MKGIGAKWVRQIDRTYDVGEDARHAEGSADQPEKGPKVIVASSECMLNKQRRIKPLFDKAVKARRAGGARALRRRRGHLHRRPCLHPPVRLPFAVGQAHQRSAARTIRSRAIDNSCVGCGNCGEVAEAAVLCPSFYRADIIHNPTGFDRFMAKLRGGVIGFLQRRRDRRRLAWLEPTNMMLKRIRHRPDPADLHRRAGDGRPGRRRAGRLDRGTGRKPGLDSRSRPRCPASPSAPAPPSIMSR